MEKTSFRLQDLVEDANLFSVIATKKGLQFTLDVDMEYEGLAIGDRIRLRQVVANGLSNAVKFTDEGFTSKVFGI